MTSAVRTPAVYSNSQCRRVVLLTSIIGLSDPFIGTVKLATKKLGVPISPTVRGPALPPPPEAHTAIEDILEEAGLTSVPEEARKAGAP